VDKYIFLLSHYVFYFIKTFITNLFLLKAKLVFFFETKYHLVLLFL